MKALTARSRIGRRLRAAAIAACVGLIGCAWGFTAPSVRVSEVRLTSLTFTEGTIQVDLEVDNPNRFALESRRFRYTLAVTENSGRDWVTLTQGEAAEPVKIPAGETGTVSVTAPFEVASLGAALGSLLRSGELEYRFTGEILAGTPLGSRRIPISQRGVFRP